ncbi:Serine/threonine-protein kinase AFC3 [Metarhizium brunneum]|uniref:Serine/threonine-protein kinase AFC3 n=1 Tax=Metarhizium brunneum TaxID=500148 RepID=A0A7D5UY12_9HYPO|nr:Serine/threonine-protein kinase AFC3 [Metarhizium brunneum]
MPYVEDAEKYASGGYHPVDIGDTICNGERAYEVIHKLGHGGFSTVWVVRSCAPSPSYFALKILCAEAVDMTDGELNVLQHLRTVAGPGHPNVVVLYDSFKISGPNGKHCCLSFPVLGPSLQKINVSAALSSNMRHQVCQQVASAMAFLHHHGVCHGDLTASSIVFELPDIQSMSPARVSQLLGPVKTENLKFTNGLCSPHAPKQVIQTPDLSGLDYSLLTQIRIIDFGQASFTDRPPPSLGVPIDISPPELCFGYLPSTKSDIWQLACIFYQIHTKAVLFPTVFQIFEILIGTIVSYLGPIPQHWKGKFNFDEYGYCEPGQVQDTTEPEWWFEDKCSEKTIDSRITQEAVHLSTYQREEYVRLLHDMVVYEPEKRLSAVEVIQRLGSASFLDEDSSELVNRR